jgi:hypothetical protein
MRDEFSRYETMRDTGSSLKDVYREAARDGLDAIALIRFVRSVYSLSLAQAKEVWVKAVGVAESLDSHEGRIAEAFSPGVATRDMPRPGAKVTE